MARGEGKAVVVEWQLSTVVVRRWAMVVVGPRHHYRCRCCARCCIVTMVVLLHLCGSGGYRIIVEWSTLLCGGVVLLSLGWPVAIGFGEVNGRAK